MEISITLFFPCFDPHLANACDFGRGGLGVVQLASATHFSGGKHWGLGSTEATVGSEAAAEGSGQGGGGRGLLTAVVVAGAEK